jgi:transcription initiation factor TFIIB
MPFPQDRTGGGLIKCEECGGLVYQDEKRGEWTCEDCGLVQDKMLLDTRPPRDSGQTGGISKVRFSSRDSSGRLVNPQQLRRLRFVDKRVAATTGDRKKAEVYSKIHGAVSTLGYDKDLAIRAEVIFHKIRKELRTNHSYLMSAAIYVAARERGTHVDLKALLGQFYEVQSHAGLVDAKKKLFRYYKRARKMLGVIPAPVDSQGFVPILSSQLRSIIGGQHGLIEEHAFFYLRCVDGKIFNASPRGVAAAAVFVSALFHNMRLSTKEVADSAGMSALTLRKYAAMLVPFIPEEWAGVVKLPKSEIELALKAGDIAVEDMETIWSLLKEEGKYVYRCSSIGCGERGYHPSKERASVCNLDGLRQGMRVKTGYSFLDSPENFK